MKLILKLMALLTPLCTAAANCEGQELKRMKALSDYYFYIIPKSDSSLYYALQAEVIVKKDSGTVTSAYADIAGNFVAFCYEKVGAYTTAYEWYHTSKQLFEQLGDTASPDYVDVCINLGNLCNTLGLYEEGRIILEKSVTFATAKYGYDKEQLDKVGGALNNLANNYNQTGEYTKAQLMYARLLTFVAKVKGSENNKETATVYSNIATSYDNLGNYYYARLYQRKATEIFRKINGPKSDEYLLGLLNLSHLYMEDKQYDSTIILCNTVLNNTGNKSNALLRAYAYNNIAYGMACEKKFDTAKVLYKKAIHIHDSLETKPVYYYSTINNLAAAYNGMKQYAGADSLLKNLLSNINLLLIENSVTYTSLYLTYCKTLILQHKYTQAQDTLLKLCDIIFGNYQKNFPGLSENEQLSYTKSLEGIFDMLYSMLLINKVSNGSFAKEAYNKSVLLKGLIMQNSKAFLENARKSGDSITVSTFKNWVSARQLLAFQLSIATHKRFYNTDSLQQYVQEQEKQLSLRDSSYFQNSRHIDYALETYKKLGSKSTVLNYVRFNYNNVKSDKDTILYGAFILTKNSSYPQFVRLCTEKELQKIIYAEKLTSNKLINKLYFSEVNNGTLQNKTAQQLYRLIWAPVKKYFTETDTIFISSTGIINNIALAALSEKNDEYLAAKYNLKFVMDARNIFDEKQGLKNNLNEISIWGNIDYGSKESYTQKKQLFNGCENLAPLDRSETLELKKLFESNNATVTLYDSLGATKAVFLREAWRRTMLHISTHGFFSNTDSANTPGKFEFNTSSYIPLLNSGLYFTGSNNTLCNKTGEINIDNGILTGYEISQLNLSGIKLVTLSACETGLGDIHNTEGVFGLQRAFKMAGVKNIIMSLWQVPDKHTSELMIAFYTNLFNGKTISNAFAEAQNAMRKKYRLPYFWAGFVLLE